MLVYDVVYTGKHESLTFLFEVSEDVTHIKSVMCDTIKSRMAQVKEEYDNAGYGSYSAHLYHSSIINDYLRLLLDIEHTYSVHDLKYIPYVNVRTRTVYTHE